MNLAFQMLHPGAKLPTRGTPQSAGHDLYACEATTIPAHGRAMVRLGFAWHGPKGHHALIYSRSGHASRGVRLANGAAVIDSDYRGEWLCCLANDNPVAFEVPAGERIAQMTLQQNIPLVFHLVTSLPASARGAGGFGSTGTA